MVERGVINRLFHKPRLHSPGHGEERGVGWLELFYDLIYVATIIQLGDALAHNVGLTGFMGFALLFVPIWLTWTGFTFYSNRFVIDDALHRGLVFAQMFAVGAMAVSVNDVFHQDVTAFAVAYACARLILVAFYHRAWRHVPSARPMTRRYVIGYSVTAVIWLLSPLVPTPWVFLAWGAAIVVDVLVALSPQSREIGMRFPPDVLHFSERYGLLTLIVLGESFVKVLSAVASQGAAVETVGLASLALLITCSLWWIYFDDVAGSRIRKGRLSAVIWVYAHLPMMIAITAVGVAAKKVVFFDPHIVEAAKYRWLLCGSLSLALLAVAIIDGVTERRQAELSDRTRVQTRMVAAFFVLLLAPAGGFMPSWAFVAMVAAACVAQVVIDLSMAPEFADPHAAHHDAQSVFEADEEEELDAAVAPSAADAPPRRDIADAVRKGTPNELRRDVYFHLMHGPWTRVFFAMGVGYVVLNIIFGALYLLDPQGVTGLAEGSFLDAFAFSVQTLTTVGYGVMAPTSTYAHVVVIIEAAVGLLFAAVGTGLIFAKASRPASPVLFSKRVVVTERHGTPTLMFRVGNARGNDIVEATVRVAVLIDEVSPEGHELRRLHDLRLVRDMTPIFALSWAVLHVIDEDSPLHGVTAEDLPEHLVTMVVTLTGYDSTYAQQTHGRKIYYPEDFRFNHRFVDVISNLDDGRIMVDYDVFHATVPDSEAEAAGS